MKITLLSNVNLFYGAPLYSMRVIEDNTTLKQNQVMTPCSQRMRVIEDNTTLKHCEQLFQIRKSMRVIEDNTTLKHIFYYLF